MAPDVVSYLPMAHIAERNCSHYFPMVFGFKVDVLSGPAAGRRLVPGGAAGVVLRRPADLREAEGGGPRGRPTTRLQEAIARGLARVRGEDGPAPDEELLAGLRAKLGLDRVHGLNVRRRSDPA